MVLKSASVFSKDTTMLFSGTERTLNTFPLVDINPLLSSAEMPLKCTGVPLKDSKELLKVMALK